MKFGMDQPKTTKLFLWFEDVKMKLIICVIIGTPLFLGLAIRAFKRMDEVTLTNPLKEYFKRRNIQGDTE